MAELSNTGDMLIVNEKLKEELNLAGSNAIFNINDFINDLDKPSFEKAWMRLINNGNFDGIINFTCQDGKVKALDINLIAIKSFSNDIVKIVLVGTDKSAIASVEERYEQLSEETNKLKDELSRTDEEINKRVREVREQLATQYKEVERIRIRNDKTIENAPIAIVGFNLQGKIEVFNKKACELWGYQPSEIIKSPISKLFPQSLVQGEGFIASICDMDKIKPLNQRELVEIQDSANSAQKSYVTLTDARVAKEHNYIAYFEVANN